jgi:hypothetical protein
MIIIFVVIFVGLLAGAWVLLRKFVATNRRKLSLISPSPSTSLQSLPQTELERIESFGDIMIGMRQNEDVTIRDYLQRKLKK